MGRLKVLSSPQFYVFMCRESILSRLMKLRCCRRNGSASDHDLTAAVVTAARASVAFGRVSMSRCRPALVPRSGASTEWVFFCSAQKDAVRDYGTSSMRYIVRGGTGTTNCFLRVFFCRYGYVRTDYVRYQLLHVRYGKAETMPS